MSDSGYTYDHFIEEDCLFFGEVISHPEKGSIEDLEHCEKMCEIIPSCLHWVYITDEYDCILFDSSSRSCNSSSGPSMSEIESSFGK